MAYNLYGGVLGFAPTTFMNRGNNLGDLTNVQQALYNLGFAFDDNTGTWTLMGTTVGVSSTSGSSGGGTNIVINEMLSNSNINTTNSSQISSQSNVNGGGGSGSGGITYTSNTSLVCKDITAFGGITAPSVTVNGNVASSNLSVAGEVVATSLTLNDYIIADGAYFNSITANSVTNPLSIGGTTGVSVVGLLSTNQNIVASGTVTGTTGIFSSMTCTNNISAGSVTTSGTVSGTTGCFSTLGPATALIPLTIGGNNSITIQLLGNFGGIIINSSGTSINSYTGTTTITSNLLVAGDTVCNGNIRGGSMTCTNTISAMLTVSGTTLTDTFAVNDTGMITAPSATIPYGISQPKVPKWSFKATAFNSQTSTGFANYTSYSSTISNQSSLYALTIGANSASGVVIQTGGSGAYFVSCQISSTNAVSQFTFAYYTASGVLTNISLGTGTTGSWQGIVYLPVNYKTGIYWTTGSTSFSYTQMSFSGYRISQE